MNGSGSGEKDRWAEYVQQESMFENAIRLRYLIWTIQGLTTPGSKLLEVGFGSGSTAVLLAGMGYSVTALDLSEELVRWAKERYGDWSRAYALEFARGDMLRLDWKDRQFDIAYHQGVLEHFQDHDIVQALREQARVARLIVFDVPNAKYGAQPFGDERLLPISRWKRLIGEAGLKVERTLGRDLPWWTHALPYGLFSHRGMDRMPSLSGRLGKVSIFVCRPA